MTNTTQNKIKKALYDMAFLDIKRASDGGSKMGAFILGSCFIEYMAGFVAGEKTTKTDYINFVKNYLPSYYNATKIYEDLRCKLVHNYSEGGTFLFVDAKPNLHLKKELKTGKMIINLENFISELEVGLNKLLNEIHNDPNRLITAQKRLSSIGILGISSLLIKKSNK